MIADFVFEVENYDVTLTVNEWDWIHIPSMGEYIYLHDFLEPSHENVTISHNDKYNNTNINEYLVKYKFRIDEKIYICVKEGTRHIEYRVTAIPK